MQKTKYVSRYQINFLNKIFAAFVRFTKKNGNFVTKEGVRIVYGNLVNTKLMIISIKCISVSPSCYKPTLILRFKEKESVKI